MVESLGDPYEASRCVIQWFLVKFTDKRKLVKVVIDRPMDRPTDGPTNRSPHIDARTHLKTNFIVII